jgi:hypothetical protein
MGRANKKEPKLACREIELVELEAIIERAKAKLSTSDHAALKAAIETLAFLTREIEAKNASIKRLRNMLFGASTEKTSNVLGSRNRDSRSTGDAGDGDDGGQVGDTTRRGCSTGAADPDAADEKPPRKGHGRNPAAAYRGAEKVSVPHESLKHGDRCPECKQGKVYRQPKPALLVRVVGMAPLDATVYELERLRCNLCGEVFTARPPPNVGDAKYDETAAAMIGLLKYGCGLPFNRLHRLQGNLGMPLPTATQWELVASAADQITPAHEELIRQAAQGEVLHQDDTTMTILEIAGLTRQAAMSDKHADDMDDRTGVFTSGIVSTGDGHKIAVFFTGRQHAGENLSALLAQRNADLGRPIQMCDASPSNTAGELDTILGNCITHARRRFVEVTDDFPEECRHVIDTLKDVYRHDAIAREGKMSPQERLALHQAQSGPLMEGLKKWMDDQIEQRRVEPNSGLGEAIGYMRKHWHELTLFLREPGAPLDNNLCERALKKAILHRKNALFYKTQNGARVGDLFMSLIHTAELCGVDPFHYLVALQRHALEISLSPAAWMPWNYREALTSVEAPPISS